MSEKFKFNDTSGIYFITPTISSWIDLFTKSEYCEIILDSLRYCQKEKGLLIHSWCIMPSHLHLIISALNKNHADIIRDFKTFTSKKITDQIKSGHDSRKEWLIRLFGEEAMKSNRKEKYKVWQNGNHPVQLDTNVMIEERLNYIHDNPVKAEYVYKAEDYVYSSAFDYADGKGLLEIVRL